MRNVILTILAHPDDAEFLCAGTVIRLVRDHSWEAHVATMTPGDCGSAEYGPEEISRMRRREGQTAAERIGAHYHCLEGRDLLVTYNEDALERVTRLFRSARPQIVITHSPSDYMLDHEMTSTLARAAAFAAPVPNFLRDRGHGPPLDKIPHLYYCDPVEGKNPLGREIAPGFCIDITRVIETKAAMLTCHASQRNWLLKHHGMDHYVQAMRDWSSKRGQQCGVGYAEGFSQHLGHSYPQDNLLGELLGTVRR